MTNTKEEQAIWDGYYGTLVGWTMHPGYSANYYRENAAKPSLEDCAAMATEMIEIRRRESNSDK